MLFPLPAIPITIRDKASESIFKIINIFLINIQIFRRKNLKEIKIIHNHKMIRKSPYIDENYSTLMSSDLNLVLTNTNNSNISFEENSLNFSNMTMKKAIEEEKSGNFNNIIEEKTPEKNENPSVRKKKQDDNQLTAFSL